MNKYCKYLSFIILTSFTLAVCTDVIAQTSAYSLRFYGNGINDIDRVKIKIDNPTKPADVGSEDFTLEFWMRALASENTAAAINCGEAYSWITGNIIIDRDRHSQNQGFGVAIAGGVVVFGLVGDGTGWPRAWTICGSSNILDEEWHHIAVQRRRSDGWMWLYVDGELEADADGPNGDIAYPDGASSVHPNDPYIVLGAEKHDAGSNFPAYSGWLDEVRISNILRYSESFTPQTKDFSTDVNTMALYHLNEGAGETTIDVSGASGGPSNGEIKFGGNPSGREWSLLTPMSTDSVNPPPVALDDSFSVPEDSLIEIDVLANDTDPNGDTLSIVQIAAPYYGTVTLLTSDIIRYTPESNFYGADSFYYRISDNHGSEDQAQVFITVLSVNDAPVALDDSILTDEENAIDIFILNNDSDVDGFLINSTIVVTDNPSNGIAELNHLSGSITFSPYANYYGDDTFKYTVSDNENEISNEAVVFISVYPVNDPPVFIDLPELLYIESQDTLPVNIWKYVSDVETADSLLSFEFENNNDSLLSMFNRETGYLDLYFSSEIKNEATLYISVTDESFALTRESIQVISKRITLIGETEQNSIPNKYILEQNFPNPFNPVTNIKFALADNGYIRLNIFTVLGQKVATLINETRRAGWYNISFFPGNFNLASGIYIYQLESEKQIFSRKMLYIR